MAQGFNESLGSSLHTIDLEDGTILMWHETIQRLASEGSVCMRPREYLHVRTVVPSNCCTVGPGNFNEGLLRTLGKVSEKGGSENSGPEVAHLPIPLNPGVVKQSSHMQAAGLVPKALVQQGTLKMEDVEIHRASEPQAATAMPLEHINLLLNQMHGPAQRNRITTSTPLLSNELDVSENEFFSHLQHTIRSVSKDREKPFRVLECSAAREDHKDGNKVLEEKLKLKELELQHMVQLLLMMQHDLEEVKGQSDLKDTKISLLAEKLKLEGKQYKENAVHFDNTCNTLRSKLLTSKADNRTFVKQLRQLLEKYEKMKKRAFAAKKQSCKDRDDKERTLKMLKEAEQEHEKLNAEQSLLKKKEEAARSVVSELKEKLQSVENDCRKNVKEKQRLENEASKMKKEIEDQGHRLQKAQNEILRLVKSLSSIELEKETARKQLLDSEEQVNALKQKLDESRVERESTSLRIKEMKREAKRSRGKLRDELLLAQENYKACETTAESLQKETETLSKLVLGLKQDNQLFKEELENLRRDKKQLEEKSQQEGKRLREVITLLGKERDLLQMELADLRKDYLNMSDRIAERMGNLGQDGTHMSFSDCEPICEDARCSQDHQRVEYAGKKKEDSKHQNKDSSSRDRNTAHTHLVIQQIKKRLQDEETRHIPE